MTEPRLASSVLVSALLRRAEAEGGFGAVLAKGDPTAGAIAVILAERGSGPRLLERLLQPDGSYAWQEIGRRRWQTTRNSRRCSSGAAESIPISGLLELDIASAERFAAEMNAAG